MENGKRSSASTKSCKKHPKHQQSPGVCSLCLRERLSKISSTSSRAVTNVSSSSSSSSISSVSSVSSSRGSSNGPSYTASPMHTYRNQRKTYDVEGKGYLSFLRKSRSMAFVSENIVEIDGKQKKSNGFWSKLIGSKRSDAQKRSMEEGSSSRLMHSKTMREMLTTRVLNMSIETRPKRNYYRKRAEETWSSEIPGERRLGHQESWCRRLYRDFRNPTYSH